MSEVFNNLDWSWFTNIIFTIIPALICITFHELSHGYVAYKLGDNTAKSQGRLTINPIKHIDIIGLLMIIFFKFGWAKPVPVNMMNFKNPKRGMAVTALAGPVSNLVLAVFVTFLYGILYRFLIPSSTGITILNMIQTTATISVALAIFNIIPIPPLDGSKILFSLIPDQQYYKLMRYERYGMIILLALVYTGVLGTPLGNAISFMIDKLSYVADAAYRLIGNFI